ncbi:MAG: hypothetical protein CVU90_12090 [Firmicutes bacterium HGW-Firmicutes-15]|nr:MAG: hypothetical protein CVU90_12090 [Firmicutes bacterium HGW-Firmicutes-15]
MQPENDYHGIIVNVSQSDKRIFPRLEILSSRTIIPGILILYKINIRPANLEETINHLQQNMRGKLFYAHLYRNDELIVIFKYRIFKASPDKTTWQEVLAYGRSLHIPSFWLDFSPCRFEDEQF